MERMREHPDASYNHQKNRWEVELWEIVTGTTEEEARLNALQRLDLYHKAVEKESAA